MGFLADLKEVFSLILFLMKIFGLVFLLTVILGLLLLLIGMTVWFLGDFNLSILLILAFMALGIAAVIGRKNLKRRGREQREKETLNSHNSR